MQVGSNSSQVVGTQIKESQTNPLSTTSVPDGVNLQQQLDVENARKNELMKSTAEITGIGQNLDIKG